MTMLGRGILGCLLILACALHAAEPKDIVGVWRTVDASDAEGRQQGGIVFRQDGSGEFISPTAIPSGPRAVLDMLETVTGGSTNMRFQYSMAADIVSITVTHFGGVPVKKANPVLWKAEIVDGGLRLSAQDDSGKWIAFRRI